ncbi:hypothetical protein AVEN_90822-1 [Araneus ventricosus]|uniref:ribonuclease H n=1 Tax=Araneus ventricosus TaxID=182803 RepID=A0A4Y2PLX0_ARAVE|nr:hypothetical protein AVEN_90822-1 [Araneus ventricosus]
MPAPHASLILDCVCLIYFDTFHGVKVHTNDFCGHPPWMENSISYINPVGNFTKSDSNNSVLISLFNQHRQFYQSYQPVFTDGSKSLNHVGCAFLTNGHIIGYKLHSFTSVFFSEITAVYFAFKYIDEYAIRKSILYTDSMSLLESLRSSSTRNPLIKEVKNFYRHLLSKGARILFSWVPSHVGITGNELADKSAKSATEFLTRPIVYADVRSAVNQWCHCQWPKKWNMETNNKLHVIKPVLSHWVRKLNRRCDVVLTRLRIGHTRLTHKYLLFAESSPTCSHCGDILTVKHILTDCVAVNRRRLRSTVQQWTGEITKLTAIHSFNWLKNQRRGFETVHGLLKPGGEAAFFFALDSPYYDGMIVTGSNPKFLPYFEVGWKLLINVFVDWIN